MREYPRQVHLASSLWWELVDGLMENKFGERQANDIVKAFFQHFENNPKGGSPLFKAKGE